MRSMRIIIDMKQIFWPLYRYRKFIDCNLTSKYYVCRLLVQRGRVKVKKEQENRSGSQHSESKTAIKANYESRVQEKFCCRFFSEILTCRKKKTKVPRWSRSTSDFGVTFVFAKVNYLRGKCGSASWQSLWHSRVRWPTNRSPWCNINSRPLQQFENDPNFCFEKLHHLQFTKKQW